MDCYRMNTSEIEIKNIIYHGRQKRQCRFHAKQLLHKTNERANTSPSNSKTKTTLTYRHTHTHTHSISLTQHHEFREEEINSRSIILFSTTV